MEVRCRSVAAAGIICLGATFSSAALADPRAVVELFTSQGCSSCPPADKLMGELAKDESLLVLSLPIDYWDYLGWKDTLAKPAHTVRQRGYAAKRGDRDVYTPQVVVNGVAHVIGSDRKAIDGAIEHASKPSALNVPVKLALDGERVQVSIAAGESGATGVVWLCTLAKAVPVAIGRGENRGRTVTYHNVVRRWVKLGKWSGETQSWTLPKDEFAEGVDSVAILVQAGTRESPGAILGAASMTLH